MSLHIEAQALSPPAPIPYPEPAWITKAADVHGWVWARTMWARACTVEGAWFDARKADLVVEKWPEWFKLTDDRFAGVPFRLSFWQEIIVRLLVGWKRPVEIIDPATGAATYAHVRLYRRLDLWIPRKNGKTEFLAALSLLFWAIEAVRGGQGFCFGRDEKQGRIVFDKMAVMIAMNPDLVRAINAFAKSMWMPERRASFEVLSGKPEGKHGRSPTVITGDEMHEWKTTELAVFLRQGTGARLQPIEIYASTAGLKSAHVGWGLFQESKAILDGTIHDPTTLVVMFCADEDDDWRSEHVWRRVNPNLGLSPTIDFLRREFSAAQQSPRAEANFRRYHLNQWVESISRWLPTAKWKACGASGDWATKAESLKGRKCYAGVDISSTVDITARVLWFPPIDDDPFVRLLCKFWVPEKNIEVRTQRDRVGYDVWSKSGAIVATPGDYVDQAFVEEQLLDDFEDFDVDKIGFDPWNAIKLVTDLQNKGVAADRFVKVRQGIPSLGEASKEFERLVFAGLVDHGGHPVMDWMGRNALVRFDRNMNFKPDKDASREKIDGIVASVTAAAVAIASVSEEPFKYTGL